MSFSVQSLKSCWCLCKLFMTIKKDEYSSFTYPFILVCTYIYGYSKEPLCLQLQFVSYIRQSSTSDFEDYHTVLPAALNQRISKREDLHPTLIFVCYNNIHLSIFLSCILTGTIRIQCILSLFSFSYLQIMSIVSGAWEPLKRK